MQFQLEELADRHGDSYQAMVRAWIEVEGRYPHNDGDLALSDWPGFLADIAAERSGEGLPPGVERQVSYVGVTPEGVVVGEFRLR